MKLIESVPNFSEGRREEVVRQIIEEAQKYERVKILDWSMDFDHNRSVVTLVGEPEEIETAIFDMVKKATELIDLRSHSGEHPRMGATDVIPFIPVMNTTMEECIEISKRVGERIGKELNIPVYLYEKSASSPDRENLAKIRKGEFEGFFEKIKDPKWKPDFGPDQVHPSAGVVAVGAREYLIAFNVNLGTNDIKIADKIAKAVRHISGGFRYVKAIGIELKEKGIVQVSMNLTNYKKSPIFRVFETIKREAQRYGVPVLNSEIIGMIPLKAAIETMKWYLQLDDFDEERVIENKILNTFFE
ncbi:glutamate formiminotransferase [Thermosipho africanus H17ap60334]|jgi:glutamate formiminotransferase|uniref:glutamate formimidoyltransferase n=1 Tax=Thermosipho africanus (strain TCF52B) TaxID=484019 RepID=B7IDC1_THEAB|nr:MULTISPECIES: glutamate formimidoyltransferase [Thermosipho]HCF38943.1 glutamate formimidoyltransferase [Thermosipho africanus]ACJ75998.1 glutamate formiminotransferase [Thermosipho africanus TCF52B]EKF49561.1 glutamate formiminotransferase [Thermosipho africanus H17ap60334]MBZ4650936.1 ftcD [Thermosipho sp. (in: thermotogales)]MDK2839766.1 glutamate formiminotransferase / 5-formyltetrahydrofolate cyclo-ligase [Thermosipho sp. (in: thermotogales)]